MKIISLTMNAFSTYKEKTTIDFEHMIESGLYLISGPTGSGKTTIFDAIAFALYGVASGSNRQQSYFRSDYADDKEETYVELTFELKETIYTIKRSPTYTRPGYKTPHSANAYLSYNDTIIEGIKEVNAFVNQLLGVDVHQFKQIVMIAQGEFTKLIYASSEEREKVLRHIFHSENLVDFENILKEKTRVYKEQYLLSSQKLSSRFALLALPQEFMQERQDGFHPRFIEEANNENEKILTQYQTSLQNYQTLKTQYDQLSTIYFNQQKINHDIEDYQNLNKQYDHLCLLAPSYETLKQDIDKLKLLEQNQTMIYQYHQLQKDITKADENMQSLKKSEEKTNKEYQTIKQNYQNISTLTNKKEKMILEIEKTKQTIQKQKTYQEISLKYNKITSTYQTLYKQYNEALQNHQNLAKRMERDQENVNQLPSLQLALQQDERLVKDINQKRILIHELSELFDAYVQIQDKHYELSEKYKQEEAYYREALLHYQKEDELFKRQQAGILASTLKDEMPCPVCGSLNHPHLASLSLEVMSSKQLEELSEIVEKHRMRKEDAYNEVYIHNDLMNVTKAKIDVFKTQLEINEELTKEVFIKLLSEVIQVTKNYEKTYRKRYEEVVYLKKIKRSLEQDKVVYDTQTKSLEITLLRLHELEKERTAYQTKQEQLLEEDVLSDNLEQKLKEDQKSLNELEKHIQTIDTTYHKLQKVMSVLQEQISSISTHQKELTQQLSYQQEKYHSFINDHFKDEQDYLKYSTMLNELNHKEKEYQEYTIQKRTLLMRIETLKESIQTQTWVDLTSSKQQLDELDQQKESMLKQSNAYDHTYKQNQIIIKDLQKDYEHNQDIFNQYTICLDLSDITSGKNTQRMSFERYVLSSYFEHILEYANVEFLKMTNGRFMMKRKQVVKGAKQQGLDLSVLDYETGMIRDIQSLSGGESFKAALSLALGLSSMIQSYAGGIELNTLFIDEGFGSLDHESITQALSALLDMKNDNKVIGIISHVDELKERIATKLVVDKGINGSHVHIEAD